MVGGKTPGLESYTTCFVSYTTWDHGEGMRKGLRSFLSTWSYTFEYFIHFLIFRKQATAPLLIFKPALLM